MKSFQTISFSGSTDYSGFDRENWPPRDDGIHRQQAQKAKEAATKAARVAIERKLGVRHSELLRLPYFNIVRCHLIDPMHNLYLGTAKNITALWKSNNILSESDFLAIQETMSLISIPAQIGRLPGKIASGFAGSRLNNGWCGLLFFPLMF